MVQDPQIHEILLRVDLLDLIGDSVKLTRSGRSYKGLCPFHAEKTPSFHVYPSDGVKPGFFRCYGCQKSGDALSFLTEKEGLTFPEALEQLARQVGVELKRRSGVSPGKHRSRLELMDQCQNHFRSNLRHPEKGRKASEYLRQRSVDDDLATRFGLGYALDSWDGLTRLFRSNDEAVQMAQAQGLIKKNEDRGSLFDFFRDRLMFPIHGPSGQLVAFAGRDLSGQTNAKYMNSAETDLFKKGRILYGLHQAKEKIRTVKRVILVEGYFDVIRMHAFGFEETVAPMGTAVTPEQMSLLERLAEEVIFLFDGDSAGVSAALRSLEQTWNLKINARVAHLPEGMDPDDFLLANSAEEMSQRLENATASFTYLLDRMVERHGLETPEQVRKVAAEVFGSLQSIQSRLNLDLRLKELAERIGVSLELLRRDWNQFENARQQRKGPVSVEDGPAAYAKILNASRSIPSEEARKGLLTLLLLSAEDLDAAMGQTFATQSRDASAFGRNLGYVAGQLGGHRVVSPDRNLFGRGPERRSTNVVRMGRPSASVGNGNELERKAYSRESLEDSPGLCACFTKNEDRQTDHGLQERASGSGKVP